MDADIKINHHKRTSLSVDFGKRASVSNIIRLANWNLQELSKQESHKDPPSPNSSDPPTPRKRNTLEEEKEILTAPSAQPSREVMQVRRRASSEGWIQAYSLSSSPSPGRVLRRTNSDGLFQSLNEGLVLTSGESYESRSQQSESGSASPRSFTDEFDDIQFEPIIRPRPITKRESVLSLQNKLVTKSEDGRKSVLAASIENLIFKLTTREVPDFDLLHEFLLTYPYYLDSFKLLEYLKDRFEYNPPQGADEALKKDYDEHRPVIRSRVYTVIKTWLKNYSFYFKKDKALLRRVRQFIDIEIGSAKKIWSDQLNALLVFLQLVNSNTNKKKKKKSSARRRNRSALTKGTTPRDNQPGSIEIVTTQSKPLVSKRSKDDLEIGAKPRSDTVFSLSSTNSDDSADTEPDSSSSKFGDFVDMDGPKSNPSIAPPSFLNSFKLSAPKSSAALLAGRDRSDSEASESSSAVSSGAATAGRISPPKIKPLPLKGLPKSSSPSPPNSPVKATVKSSREEVKKPLSGKSNVDSPRTERDRSKSGLRSPLTSPKAPEGEAFRRTHNRVRSTGNARIHAIVSPKDSPNGSLDVVEEEEKQKELEKARIKARVTKYKNELFNANIVKKPRNDFSPLLLSLDPAELAKQLTLVEHKKFSLIAPTELMMTNWKKKDRRTVSKRVCILIEWFNKMTAWVASEIVSAPILKQRVAVITFFIRVCEACKELNNYNTLMEILSGLDMTAVVRLKSTWEHVSKKDMQSLEELRDIVSRNDNYSRYRQEVDAINTPTPYLPYIGLLLQDLVALEELPTIDRDGLVNFRKFKRVSKILQRVHDLKILNFKLEPVVPLQKYLKKGLQVLGDMDLLRFSRVCEPSQQAMLF